MRNLALCFVLAVGGMGLTGKAGDAVASAPSWDAMSRRFNLKWEKGERKLRADVDFLTLRIPCSFVDVSSPNGIGIPLQVKYNVFTAAPWALTDPAIGHDDKGWQVIWLDRDHYRKLSAAPVFDLSTAGVNHADYLCRIGGAAIPKGAACVIRPGVFQVRWVDTGGYLRNANDTAYVRPGLPEWMGSRNVSEGLVCVFANLSGYRLALTDFHFAWEKGGTGRARWILTDADGEKFPALNAAIAIQTGDFMAPLKTELTADYRPTGWMTFSLPTGLMPEKLKLNGEILLSKANGETGRESVDIAVKKGETLGDAPTSIVPASFPLPTRAIWVVEKDLADSSRVDAIVDRAADCGINTLLGGALVGDKALFSSEIFPFGAKNVAFDPLGALIEKGHAKGLKVHAVVCVNHRREAFRKWFKEKRGEDISNMYLGFDGKPAAQRDAVCMRSPAYRDFIVEIADEISKKYPIDGLQLDYIRAKAFCCCERCAMDFQKRFGKTIAAATNQDWALFYKDPIDDLVKRVAETVRKYRPDAVMSVAAAASEDGKTQGQFVGEWARNYGYAIMPMAYGAQTLYNLKSYRYFVRETGDPKKVVMGLGLYSRVYDDAIPADGAKLAIAKPSRPTETLIEQVNAVEAVNCGGVAFFSSRFLTPEIAAELKRVFNVSTQNESVKHENVK